MLECPAFFIAQGLAMVRTLLDDLLTVQRISAVPAILQVLSETTGLRFAAVARVTETNWTACAVFDRIEFGLKVGGELDVTTTLCSEIHASHQPIIISQVSADPDYCHHHTPQIYGFESYISVPVLRANGSFFGTLCALDPLPRDLSSPATRAMFESFARLLTLQLDAEEQQQSTRAALADEAPHRPPARTVHRPARARPAHPARLDPGGQRSAGPALDGTRHAAARRACTHVQPARLAHGR